MHNDIAVTGIRDTTLPDLTQARLVSWYLFHYLITIDDRFRLLVVDT